MRKMEIKQKLASKQTNKFDAHLLKRNSSNTTKSNLRGGCCGKNR